MHLLAKEVGAQGCEVQKVYTGALHKPWQLASSTRRLAPQTRGFDLVHAQYGSGCAFVASKLPRALVLTLRGTDWYGVQRGPWGLRLRCAIGRRLTRHVLPRYPMTLVASRRMMASVRALSPKANIEVLPSGIDLSKFEGRK